MTRTTTSHDDVDAGSISSFLAQVSDLDVERRTLEVQLTTLQNEKVKLAENLATMRSMNTVGESEEVALANRIETATSARDENTTQLLPLRSLIQSSIIEVGPLTEKLNEEISSLQTSMEAASKMGALFNEA